MENKKINPDKKCGSIPQATNANIAEIGVTYSDKAPEPVKRIFAGHDMPRNVYGIVKACREWNSIIDRDSHGDAREFVQAMQDSGLANNDAELAQCRIYSLQEFLSFFMADGKAAEPAVISKDGWYLVKEGKAHDEAADHRMENLSKSAFDCLSYIDQYMAESRGFCIKCEIVYDRDNDEFTALAFWEIVPDVYEGDDGESYMEYEETWEPCCADAYTDRLDKAPHIIISLTDPRHKIDDYYRMMRLVSLCYSENELVDRYGPWCMMATYSMNTDDPLHDISDYDKQHAFDREMSAEFESPGYQAVQHQTGKMQDTEKSKESDTYDWFASLGDIKDTDLPF